MSGVHLSLEALSRGWLAASVVSCRWAMVKVVNMSCRDAGCDQVSGGWANKAFPHLPLSFSQPFAHFFPPYLQI